MNPVSETRIIVLVTLIQFIYVIDFMMIAPLGPDFTEGLGIKSSDIGFILSSYTIAAAFASFAAAYFLDRFERRVVVAFGLIGLAIATYACTLATNLSELIWARTIAGLFGGPAASVAIAMLIDTVPNERRGRAMGMVMGAFSISSVLGIPIGLELSHYFGWQSPFYVVAFMALVVIVLIFILLPPMTSHLVHLKRLADSSFIDLFRRRVNLMTYSLTFCGMFAAFLILPNIAVFVQNNIGFPREYFGLLYLLGGTISFFVMRFTGKWIDEKDATSISIAGTVLLISVLVLGFTSSDPFLPIVVTFVGIMMAMSIRNVVSTSISSMIPENHERAAFTSVNHSVSHTAAGAGAIVSSMILTSNVDGSLSGLPNLITLAVVFAFVFPFFIFYLVNHLNHRESIKNRHR